MSKINHFTQLVTPEQAKIWLMCNYKHQRKIDLNHVALLKRAMNNEQFAPTEPLSFSVLNRDQHLLNGQHTLSAIVSSGKPQHLIVIQHEVKNESEEADLYFKFDRPRTRNFSDGVRAIGLTESINLQSRQIGCGAASLRFIRGNWGVNNYEMRMVTIEELLEWVGHWAWEVRAVDLAVSPCSMKEKLMVTRRCVYSVALVTMRYQPKKAREFWSQVAKDDGLDRYDPRKTLRNWLQARVNSGENLAQPKVKLHEAARAVALAWNAFFEDRTLQSIQVRDKTCTMRLLGTIYNGRQDPDFLPLYLSPNLEAERDGQLPLI